MTTDTPANGPPCSAVGRVRASPPSTRRSGNRDASGAALQNVKIRFGGRGSGALSALLVSNPRVQLTVAINGYDDGASTGEVRRFLGDSLGPSDFRKNASRLATELAACDAAIVRVLDRRLPRAGGCGVCAVRHFLLLP